MTIVHKISTLRKILSRARLKRQTIGFVPTMGSLHAGHAALLKACRKQNDISVLCVFVNPKQFGPSEDFRRYPRNLKKDVLLAKKEKVDIIFHPSAEEIYPAGYLTTVHVHGLSGVLCGRTRPGHFDGVATVVSKLLNIVMPDCLYLGQKDAQQCVILRRMIQDLNFPVKLKILQTIREPDGLALSSRNSYLSADERKQAVVLCQALCLAQKAILGGERRGLWISRLIQGHVHKNSHGKIDDVACVDADTLTPQRILKGKVLLALAVNFGKTRLIDNKVLMIP